MRRLKKLNKSKCHFGDLSLCIVFCSKQFSNLDCLFDLILRRLLNELHSLETSYTQLEVAKEKAVRDVKSARNEAEK